MKTCFLLLASLLSSAAAAQSVTVEGYVFNAQTGAPLENAWVYFSRDRTLETFVLAAITDANGFYVRPLSESDLAESLYPTATCAVTVRGRLVSKKSGDAFPIADDRDLVLRNLYIKLPEVAESKRCSRVPELD